MPGKRRSITENTNLWAVLTTDTFTPLIEFDFLGSDAWALLGKTDVEMSEMSGGDKLELRKHQVSLFLNILNSMWHLCTAHATIKSH